MLSSIMPTADDCVIFFSPSVYARAVFRPRSDFQVVSCELTQAVRMDDGTQILDVSDVVRIEGSLVREVTQDFDTDPPCIITLWHDQAAVYDPDAAVKLYILTISFEGGDGVSAIEDADIDEFKAIVSQLRLFAFGSQLIVNNSVRKIDEEKMDVIEMESYGCLSEERLEMVADEEPGFVARC